MEWLPLVEKSGLKRAREVYGFTRRTIVAGYRNRTGYLSASVEQGNRAGCSRPTCDVGNPQDGEIHRRTDKRDVGAVCEYQLRPGCRCNSKGVSSRRVGLIAGIAGIL